MLDLLLPFFDDAGIIMINTHLFNMLEFLDLEADDGDLPVADAVSILRFFVTLVELGADDVIVQGQAVLDLIERNFPSLHALLTSQEFGARAPINSRFNYSRFCLNFQHLTVSFELFIGNTI